MRNPIKTKNQDGVGISPTIRKIEGSVVALKDPET